ncbi:MAG TPA: UvrD-helicase domain-containing protein [Gammaproteobacteria bacterium]|nr:UvrD-helicase domain-containing protein [Gammaproteobacteria bacterium]
MQDLNPEQHAAVQHLSSPLLVLAGAGSGKTRVITDKIAYLINECDYKPNKIYAVTFTNKAARAMADRVNSVLGNKAKGLVVSTFHTLGLNFIRQEHKLLNLKANISIYDSEDSLNLLRDISGKDNIDVAEQLSTQQQQISNWKSASILPEQAIRIAKDPTEFAIANLYATYQQTLRSYNAVDFDDLILLPLELLRSSEQVREKWQNKIQYLLVDEYQDTNTTQYELVRLFTGARAAFTVVGDNHQAIYAWRGANQENLQKLQVDFPNLKVITLEQNYRSTGTILQAANHLISHNPNIFSKNLWSTLGTGDPIRIIVNPNEQEEANRIAAEIHQHKFLNQTKFSDYAVMYRSNHQARIVEQALREYAIPYQLSGGTSFFAKSEVKDIMAYLKILVNPDDDGAFLRIANVPRREIGPATLEKLSQYAQMRDLNLFTASFELGLEQTLSGKPLQKLREFCTWLQATADEVQEENSIAIVRGMLERIDYATWLLDTCTNPAVAEKRMENINELIAWLERMLKDELTLSAAVNKMLLIDMLTRKEEESNIDRVNLLTLHAAKGLEFPQVFILGMEEELLPHRNSMDANTIEEERRLMYVGLTRAQYNLTLTLCKQRRRYKELVDCEPSRFLEELPPDLITWEEPGSSKKDPVERQQHGKAQLSALKAMLQKSV